VLVGLAILWVVLVPVALVAARALRLRRAAAPSAQVLIAWSEAQEALAPLGALRHPSETHREFALRAHQVASAPGDALDQLASMAELADYAGEAAHQIVDPDAARRAARIVQSHARARTPWFRRCVRWLDPRPMLPRAARAIDTRLTDELLGNKTA
jgi:hypothetical protein